MAKSTGDGSWRLAAFATTLTRSSVLPLLLLLLSASSICVQCVTISISPGGSAFQVFVYVDNNQDMIVSKIYLLFSPYHIDKILLMIVYCCSTKL